MTNSTMKVIVTDYVAEWVELFNSEASKIGNIFKDEIIAIHHIGSTAVPNLKAKPIIDIMPVVKDLKVVDTYNAAMTIIGYEPLGEFGIKGRRFFRKGGQNRTHHVHIFQLDNEHDINRHLAVRDYLKMHKHTAIEYGKLKEQLAKKFPNDSEGYSVAKADFVENLERKALAFKKNSKS